MTQSFIDMIYLFSCAVMGIKPELDHDIDISKIYEHSLKQNVWDIVFFSVKYLYDEGKVDIEPVVFNTLRDKTIVEINKNKQRNSFIHQIMKKFEEYNIEYCVLKGEILAYLYENSNSRISADTDILIDIKNKNNVIKVLKEFDFDVSPLNSLSPHLIATHPVGGVVEIHIRLYHDIFEDVWFNNKALNKEKYRIVRADDLQNIPTLGITDGLIFISLHYIKHFLSLGVGIRQLMDIMLYMKYYFEEIDWERYNNLMQHLKYKKFIDNCIGIGVKYLNLDEKYMPQYNCDDNIVDRILHDIEIGGAFGKDENERHGFCSQYTKAVFNRFKYGDYEAYIKKRRNTMLIQSIFPSAKNLSRKFPYIKKLPILYPVAWLHRLLNFFVSCLKKEKSINKSFKEIENLEENDTIKRRMDLVREVDML